MTLRKNSPMRTLLLSLLFATPFLGVACLDPDLQDAEIGCGVDAMVNAKCPNRPPVEAGPPSPDGGPPDVQMENGDALPAPADAAADRAVADASKDGPAGGDASLD